MPIVSTMKMTALQFVQLGEDPPGVRLELVDGQVAIGPSWTPDHSHAVVQLVAMLGERTCDIGELLSGVNTFLGEFDVRRPDLLFFSNPRRHLIGETAIEGPPDLAVEVVSESSIEIDRQDKFVQYRNNGVANYWIIDPALQTVDAWRLENHQYVAAGHGQGSGELHLPPFSELAIPIQKLWRK